MSAVNFYPVDEFEYQVQELVEQGWSRFEAVNFVTLQEERDAMEYHAWADSQFEADAEFV